MCVLDSLPYDLVGMYNPYVSSLECLRQHQREKDHRHSCGKYRGKHTPLLSPQRMSVASEYEPLCHTVSFVTA
jgi:hypothetical protein